MGPCGPPVSTDAVTQLVAISAGIVGLAAFLALVTVPVAASYQRAWERVVAGVLSLAVGSVLFVSGTLAGQGHVYNATRREEERVGNLLAVLLLSCFPQQDGPRAAPALGACPSNVHLLRPLRVHINQVALERTGPKSAVVEYGGSGSMLSACIAVEELGRVCYNTAYLLVVQWIPFGAILAGGTKEQQDRYLPGLASGELRAAFSTTEPQSGSDVQGIRTKATRVAGGYRLDGAKIWCTNSPVADFILVAARRGDELAARIAEIALPVKFAYIPRGFRAYAVYSTDEVTVGNCMSRLFELPQVFR